MNKILFTSPKKTNLWITYDNNDMTNWRNAEDKDLFKCNVLLLENDVNITREMKNVEAFTHEPDIVDDAIKEVIIDKPIYEHDETITIENDTKKYSVTVNIYKITEKHYHIIGNLNYYFAQ